LPREAETGWIIGEAQVRILARALVCLMVSDNVTDREPDVCRRPSQMPFRRIRSPSSRNSILSNSVDVRRISKDCPSGEQLFDQASPGEPLQRVLARPPRAAMSIYVKAR
jgi:hypothetical protein